MPRSLVAATLALFLLVAPVLAQANGSSDAASEFTSYQLVLLVVPDDAPELTEEQARALQVEHRAHLSSMEKSGKMMIAGPFSDQPDASLRGMCIYRVGSLEEARRLAESDPAVKAGRLEVQVMTWWVFADRIAFPKAPVVTGE